MNDKEMSAFMAVFGAMANGLGPNAGGDRGQAFPASDAEDFAKGARYIPGEVTLARRDGKRVIYDPAEQTWTMPDGKKIAEYRGG